MLRRRPGPVEAGRGLDEVEVGQAGERAGRHDVPLVAAPRRLDDEFEGRVGPRGCGAQGGEFGVQGRVSVRVQVARVEHDVEFVCAGGEGERGFSGE